MAELKETPNNKKLSLIIVFCILLLALALRIWGLGAKSLWIDEALTVLRAHNGPGWLARFHFPVSYLLFWIWSLLAGNSLSVAFWRFFPVLWDVSAVYLVYALGRKLFDEPATALWSAGIMAIGAYFINQAQFIRYPSILMFFSVSAVYFFWTWLQSRKVGHLAAHVVCLSLGIGTHAYEVLLLPAFAIYIFLEHRRARKVLLQWIGAQAVLFIPLFLIFVANKIFVTPSGDGDAYFGFLPLKDIIAHLKTIPVGTIPHILAEFTLGAHWVASGYSRELLAISFTVVGLLMAFSALRLKAGKSADKFLWIVLLTPMFLSWILMLVWGLWARAQYLCIVAPLFCLILARGIVGKGLIHFRRLLAAGLLLVLTVTLWNYYRYPRLVKSSNNAAILVSERISEGEIVVVINSWEKYLFQLLMPDTKSFVIYNSWIDLKFPIKSRERGMKSVADADDFVSRFPRNTGVWIIFSRAVPCREDMGGTPTGGRNHGFLDQAMEKRYRVDPEIGEYDYEPVWYAGEVARVVHYIPLESGGADAVKPGKY